MFATDGVNAINVTVPPTMARNRLGCREIDFFRVHYLSVRHFGIQAFVYAGQPIYWMLRHTRTPV